MEITTENSANNLVISSRKRRIAAFLIDHFTMSFLIVGLVFALLGTNYLNHLNIGRMLIGMLLGFFIYFAKDSIKGISFGKWIMGIMVRDENNFSETPSFGRLFLRNLFVVIWPVEFIVLASSDKKKRIGDNVAHTVVLKNPNKSKVLPRILGLVGVGIIFALFVLLFVMGAMKSSDAYKTAVHEIENNTQVQAETGGIVGYGFMPAGSISVSNGQGEAQLEITVIGKIKTVEIDVQLEKEPDKEWKVIKLEL
jgi:uncharacterized RDD family membrane protein YckC